LPADSNINFKNILDFQLDENKINNYKLFKQYENSYLI
jgi:hypothetical protein